MFSFTSSIHNFARRHLLQELPMCLKCDRFLPGPKCELVHKSRQWKGECLWSKLHVFTHEWLKCCTGSTVTLQQQDWSCTITPTELAPSGLVCSQWQKRLGLCAHSIHSPDICLPDILDSPTSATVTESVQSKTRLVVHFPSTTLTCGFSLRCILAHFPFHWSDVMLKERQPLASPLLNKAPLSPPTWFEFPAFESGEETAQKFEDGMPQLPLRKKQFILTRFSNPPVSLPLSCKLKTSCN